MPQIPTGALPGEQSPKKESLPKNKWQEIYVTQLSYLINLIMGMATAAVGFCVSQLISHSDKSHVDPTALVHSSYFFAASILFGGLCTALRLIIFDRRRAHPEYGLEPLIASLVVLQSLAFVAGVIWLGIDVISYWR
jgi:cation transporter-like permease